MSEDYFHNFTEDPDCRSNYSIVLMFVSDADPGYFRYRWHIIIVLFSLGVLGVILNLFMAGVIIRSAEHKHSVNALLTLQLFLADLFVAVFCLLTDGIWNMTMQWLAGSFACRLVKFTQMFSLYATTIILTGMTIERCITVTFPISRSGRESALRRSRIISGFAWAFAGLCSIPQAVLFHVERAPICPDFYQCVTHGTYQSPAQELIYTILTLCLLFLIPFLIICICYVIIFASWSSEAQIAIGRNASQDSDIRAPAPKTRKRGQRMYLRTRRISLLMTFVIATTFIICWAPYYTLVLAHYFNWVISNATTKSLLCFGVSNSVLNPMIFGYFRFSIQKKYTPRPTANGHSPMQEDYQSTLLTMANL